MKFLFPMGEFVLVAIKRISVSSERIHDVVTSFLFLLGEIMLRTLKFLFSLEREFILGAVKCPFALREFTLDVMGFVSLLREFTLGAMLFFCSLHVCAIVQRILVFTTNHEK